MALQASPNKRSKVYRASSKVRLLPAPEQTQKHPSPTDMLRLFSFGSHAILNSPSPQEHLSSLLQSTPCWNLNRKSRFNALSTCEWQLYPQGSLGATLIGPSAPTRFWVGKIGANQVWKVLRAAPYEIRRRTFWKSRFQAAECNAPINVKPQGGGGGGRATHGKLTESAFPWVGILTFSVAPGSGIWHGRHLGRPRETGNEWPTILVIPRSHQR